MLLRWLEASLEAATMRTRCPSLPSGLVRAKAPSKLYPMRLFLPSIHPQSFKILIAWHLMSCFPRAAVCYNFDFLCCYQLRQEAMNLSSLVLPFARLAEEQFTQGILEAASKVTSWEFMFDISHSVVFPNRQLAWNCTSMRIDARLARPTWSSSIQDYHTFSVLL